MFELSLWSLL